MTKYLAGVLTVIAGGVLLIAYGLLAPQTSASSASPGQVLGVQPAAYVIVPASAAASTTPHGVASMPMTHNVAAPTTADVTTMPVEVGSAVAGSTVGGSAPLAQPAVYREVVEDRSVPSTIEYRPTSSEVSLNQGRRTTVVAQKKRDWKKTALIVGGSSAGGAGVGALIGGKKGALVGAAVGGGASALYEALKK